MESTPTADFAKLLKDTLAPIMQEIISLKAGDVNKSRKQTLEEKLKDVNPTLKAMALKNLDRMNIDSNEAFNAFIEETIEDAKQIMGKSSANTPKPATEQEIDAVMKGLIEPYSGTNEPRTTKATDTDSVLDAIFKHL